ncbi:MAG: dolichyl-phosphate beta-glucosyltransferase [Planctomycetota bacterium]
MADLPIRISVVIPAYNEASRIKDSLGRIASYFERQAVSYEVIVVDDGSTDDTAAVVRSMAKRIEHLRLLTSNTNRGKGHAVRHGIAAARGDYVLMSDADLSTPIEEVEKLMRALKVGGYDVAIGSRAMPQSDVRLRQTPVREGMGKLFNLLVRLLVMRGFGDTQCGFKCFRANAARLIFTRQRIDGFCFDVEALMIARKAGLRVKEVPVVWLNSPESRVHILHAPIQMFWDLLRIALGMS